MRATGKTIRRTVAGEVIATIVPYPLPPRDPPLNVGGELAATLARAEHALARLDVAGEMVPSLRLVYLCLCAQRGSDLLAD